MSDTEIEATRLDVALSSGERAHAIVSRDTIGVAVGARACVAHRRWMTAEELRQLSVYAAELADHVYTGDAYT